MKSCLVAPPTGRQGRSQLLPKRFRDSEHVLVSATGETDDDHLLLTHSGGHFDHLSDGMRGLQRRNNALEPAGELKRFQRFTVGDRNIIYAVRFLQPGM